MQTLEYNKQVRFEVDNIIIQYKIFDKNAPIIFTFSPGGCELPQKHTTYIKDNWGFNFFATKGINIFTFNHMNDDEYFSSPTFTSFLKKLSTQFNHFPQRIGYGASRGAFGVALHAEKLELNKALLLMPISTYNKNITPWCRKAIRASDKVRDQDTLLDSSKCNVPLTIIYDPLYISDRKHQQRYSSCIESLKIPAVGHTIVESMQNMGILKSTVLEFIEGDIDHLTFYKSIRKRRELDCYFKGTLKNSSKKIKPYRARVVLCLRAKIELRNLDLQKVPNQWKTSIEKRILKIIGKLKQ